MTQRKRKTLVETVELPVVLSREELLIKGEDRYVALELLMQRVQGQPADAINRLRTYLCRGKYNTATVFGVRALHIDKPYIDEDVSVRLKFKKA